MLSVYDPCCGSGGMLTIAKEHISARERREGERRGAGAAFDYAIANPPCGKDWKRDQDAVQVGQEIAEMLQERAN